MEERIIEKYNVPVPRYTSYPTVPHWQEHIDISKWVNIFQRDFHAENKKNGISLYIHLPFCESMCTYCGCNKRITTDHDVEDDYLITILKEWQLYLNLTDEKPVLRELHLGGGTPTFFSPERLVQMLSYLLESVEVHPEHEFSFEGHPNNTTKEHLEALYNIGFRRVSFGVQDNDPEVQRIINRIQPFEQVRYVTELARSIGYESVNFDLIYGLPLQTIDSITRTIEQTISLKPDRVAFYSYAHVPWTSKGQRFFDENDLPAANEKLKLYETGKALFLKNGYEDIGMDHFTLSTDRLYKVAVAGKLHRNFMGYTTQPGNILIGLGVSSISSTANAYAQNTKKLQDYYNKIDRNEFAVDKGYFLSEEDKRLGKYILNISCRGRTEFCIEDMVLIKKYSLPLLQQMEVDGLLKLSDNALIVTKSGKNFIRNICSAFDIHLLRSKVSTTDRVFSKAI